MTTQSAQTTEPYGPHIVPGHTRLVVVSGPVPVGYTFSLSGVDHSIGKAAADIALTEDAAVSDDHATIAVSEAGAVLRGSDSTNGLWLRIRAAHALVDGQEFRVGDQFFRYNQVTEQETYPSADGTLHFVSPPRPVTFSVTQILEGGRPGLVSSSADRVTIGTTGASVNFLTDSHLSDVHAGIAAGAEGVLLEDLGSLNGTYVRVAGDCTLQHGDFFFAGRTLLRVEMT